ncbi:MAG: DEAD/DEAH box helicase [Anaerolineae bacterium]
MSVRNLADRLPEPGTATPDEVLDLFLDWVIDRGLEPYPAQEEALLELMTERHVVLSTPTGSGKSLVAQGLHFKAMSEGERSFYTSPTKALASEKFFALCDEFGADNVGMLTGDAAINRDAPIICCTAEILSNMALRGSVGELPAYVVMDEFHFYADPDRGVAWQVPLLTMPDSTFLLMSATLGDMDDIATDLELRTGRAVAHVTSDQRPVPLDYEYRETPLHETVEHIVGGGRAPVYIVSFTQRECGELAQALTSVNVCSKDEKARLADALRRAEFDTPYGKEISRFLRSGIAVHHGGLLPKYRLLVEQLSQQGLLKIICGTDTLGVGVNIPIRTVLFNKLSKYDGRKVGILKARDFRQISGRAGRKGFDDRGSVVCQAPEHIIEKRRQEMRAALPGSKKKVARKKPPPGTIVWDNKTFDQLITRPPEALMSQFSVSHGMILNVLQRADSQGQIGLPAADAADGDAVTACGGRGAGGYGFLVDLVMECHEPPDTKLKLLRGAAERFRALRRAEIISLERDETGTRVVVSEDLQEDFSLNETLSLYLVDAVAVLDPGSPEYALDVLSFVEAILEDPRAVLIAQERKAKGELIARLKADGVQYEERMAHLEDVTYPKPNEDFIEATFSAFAARHPWVAHEDIKPKSIAREMYEGYVDFADYVRRYGLQRSEGLLLRHLSQTYKTLAQSVPEPNKSDEVYDIEAYLRTLLTRIDSSLIEEWERMLGYGELMPGDETAAEPGYDIVRDRKLLEARARAEMHSLVRALAARDFEEAARWVRYDEDDPWDAARLERALEPFFEEHEEVVFTPSSRRAEHTMISQTDARKWTVTQILVDPAGDNLWYVAGAIDLSGETDPSGPLVAVYDISR